MIVILMYVNMIKRCFPVELFCGVLVNFMLLFHIIYDCNINVCKYD